MTVALHDKPMASAGFTSYRYRGRYGFIMIGANSHAEGLREAARSTEDTTTLDRLEVWNGRRYTPAEFTPETSHL